MIKYDLVWLVSGTHRTHGDELVAVVHHRDQQVQQDDDVDQREASEHDQTPEPGQEGDLKCAHMKVELH